MTAPWSHRNVLFSLISQFTFKLFHVYREYDKANVLKCSLEFLVKDIRELAVVFCDQSLSLELFK